MSHIQYTICRSGTYFYNRRVPKHAVGIYGSYIRQALSKDPDEAQAYAERLSNVLESFKPRSVMLSEIAEEYVSLRKINQKPPRVACVFRAKSGSDFI